MERKRKGLLSNIEKAKKYLRIARNIDPEQASEEDVTELRRIVVNFNANRYDVDKGTMYLSKMIGEYESLAKPLARKASTLLSKIDIDSSERFEVQTAELDPSVLSEMGLGEYVDRLGLPGNTDYFALVHILDGNYVKSGNEYGEIFEKFTDKLTGIKPSGEQRDIEFMQRLRLGIENSLKQSHVLRELKKQRGYKDIIDNMFNQVDDYVAQCKALVT